MILIVYLRTTRATLGRPPSRSAQPCGPDRSLATAPPVAKRVARRATAPMRLPARLGGRRRAVRRPERLLPRDGRRVGAGPEYLATWAVRFLAHCSASPASTPSTAVRHFSFSFTIPSSLSTLQPFTLRC